MSEIRDWGNGFVSRLSIKPDTVLEVGCAPLSWGGAEVDSIDQKGGPGATIIARLEEYKFSKSYDLVSFIWALSYCLQPDRAVQRAVDLLNDGGHLLIVTRVYGHKFVSPPGEKGGCVWIPTTGWLDRMDQLYPLELVKSDYSTIHGSWAGLWRKLT